MRYFELTPAQQRSRLERRQAEAPHMTWHISDEGLAGWAANIHIPTPGELDGSEPIDDPPAGFATWDEWRRYPSGVPPAGFGERHAIAPLAWAIRPLSRTA